jgi:hypothetical protein
LLQKVVLSSQSLHLIHLKNTAHSPPEIGRRAFFIANFLSKEPDEAVLLILVEQKNLHYDGFI